MRSPGCTTARPSAAVLRGYDDDDPFGAEAAAQDHRDVRQDHHDRHQDHHDRPRGERRRLEQTHAGHQADDYRWEPDRCEMGQEIHHQDGDDH